MHKLTLVALPLLATGLLGQGTAEVEPNDNSAQATTLAVGRQGDAAISVGDSDFWKITLTQTADLRCWINPGIGASIADSDLALLASDGTTELAFNDNATSPASWLSAIVTGPLVPGDYYLRVRSSQAFDPSGTGTYTLDVVAALPGTYFVNGGNGPGIPTPIAEGPENNDPRQSGGVATPSFENSINTGNLSATSTGASFTDPGADYDFYEINITRQGLLTMETLVGAGAPASVDTVLFIATASQTLLAFDDDGGAGQLSLLSYYVGPGTYFVAVKGDAGNYELDIELTPQAPSGAASVTVQPGGCGPTLTVRSTTAGPVVQTEVPILGSSFYVDGDNMPANALIIHVIGTELLAQPFDMGPYGAPGCLLEVDPIDQSPANSNSTGQDYWLLRLPLDVALIGLTVEQQTAVVDSAANALGVTITNRVSTICGVN